MLCITNVRLIDPIAGLDAPSLDTHGALLVRDGRIADAGRFVPPEGAEIVDGQGAVLCPGLVDLRVGIGEPGGRHHESVATAAQAASFGGITTVAALPDTSPAIDEPALVRLLRARGEETGLGIHPYGALTRGCAGAELAEMGLLREAGAIAFTDGGRTLAPARLMRTALLYARGLDALIVQHPEEPSLAQGGVATEGERATRMGLPSIPAEAEAIQVVRDLALLRLTGGRLHFAHISTAAALTAIRQAKDSGLAVTCDTAPPYFDLNETAIGDWRTYVRLSPPLRMEADRRAVVAALADGTIDAIASDHQPRAADEKRLPFAQAASGGTGLATLLAVTLAQVHGGTLTLSQALALLTSGPARVLRIDAGTLAVGAAADLTLFDPERAWQVGRLPGRAQNTPFDGRALEGRVIGTWRAGIRVFDAASYSSAPYPR